MLKCISVSFAIFLISSSLAFASNNYSLSKGDKALLQKAMSYAKTNKYEKAKKHASYASDKYILKIILWMQYQDKYENNTYKQITDFIEKHPDWPRIKRLRNRAEGTLNNKMEAELIVNFFKDEEPITGHAMRLLAEAKTKLGHSNADEIKNLLRTAWIQGDFIRDDEKSFLEQHGEILRKEDHVKRIDRLLWEHKITIAKRLIGKVDHEHRSLFTARIKLIQSQRGVDAAVHRVAKHLKSNPGFIYERIKWHQRRRSYDRVYEYISDIKEEMPHQRKWWKIKSRLIREYLEEKKYKEAYKVARNHGNSAGGADFAEGEWLAGWISLSFLDNPRKAYEHFYQLYENVSFPVSRARGAYWAGRAAEKNNNNNIANKWYRIAAKHPTTFYGQLAHMRVKSGEKVKLPDFPKLSYNELAKHKNNGLLKAAYLLVQSGRNKLAEKFIIQAIRNTDSESQMAAISKFGGQVGRKEFSVLAAKHALRKGVILTDTGWPEIDKLPKSEVESSLILGIIRQESSFNTDARSPAKASGLMQLIPPTAKRVSRQLKLRYNRYKLTKDPDYNMKLGSTYLGGLINRFEGSYILAILSYNAGPTNVRRWIRRYGDPRKLSSHEEVLDWIELVPFAETRNYVQRVLENAQVYRNLTNKAPLKIESDLMRATGS